MKMRRSKSKAPLAERLRRGLRLNEKTGCLEWTGHCHWKGHGQISIGGRNAGIGYTHVVAWEMENGPVPEGMIVCHRCDSPACCNPEHLFLGTRADCTALMVSKNRHSHGERHAVKLNSSIVLRIKELLRLGLTQQEIADDFGVARSMIGLIKQGKRWKHLSDAA